MLRKRRKQDTGKKEDAPFGRRVLVPVSFGERQKEGARSQEIQLGMRIAHSPVIRLTAARRKITAHDS